MILYLDTNIILSYYNEKDPFHDPNKRLLGQQELTFVTGFITVIEFESVFGKLWQNNQIQLKLNIEQKVQNIPISDQVKYITETCFSRLPITVLPVSSLDAFKFNEIEYIIENTFSLAYRIGPQLQLRTLDILQIASAVKIKQFTNFNVEYFLTNDENILNNSGIIRTTTTIIPISPDDFLSLLKI